MRKANPAGEVTGAKAVRAESYCGARDGQAVGEVTGGCFWFVKREMGKKSM